HACTGMGLSLYGVLKRQFLIGELIFTSCTINILLYKNRVYNRNVDLIGKREKPYQAKEYGVESVY
ncbi:hypothetical protein, partial [Priestia megaterium]|uniref:hypothetical protein n=1 Tax=Priestia megaterium TaxID=1404 RepID=UPI003000429F